MGRAAPDVPDSMRGIHGRFTRWRKSHTGRLPIPESLWAAAAEVARETRRLPNLQGSESGIRQAQAAHDRIASGRAENCQAERTARRICRVTDARDGRRHGMRHRARRAAG